VPTDVETVAEGDASPPREAGAPSGRPGGVGAWFTTWWPLCALGAVAVLISVWSQHVVFPAFSWNRDEPQYLWQVAALRDGKVLTTDGGAPLFFQPWLSGASDGHFFSQYTLGWPLVLLVGDVVFGSAGAGVAFGALLAVLGTYALARELLRDHVLALVAAAIVTLSPIVAIQGGVYLGYLFTLGLGQLFAAALLSGIRRTIAWRVVAAGAMLGYIFLTRPYDAVLWGLAVGGYALWVYRKEWRTLVGPLLWFAAGSLPLVVVTLAYNVHVTGSPTSFPITAADPLDKFFFGTRRIAERVSTDQYGLYQAVRGTGKNGVYVPLFLTGTYVGVLVAAYGAWLRRREQSTLALLAMIAVFPLGYFFFWGMKVSAITVRISGPIYLIPLYGPLAILIASVVVYAWRKRTALGVGLVALLVVATVPLELNRLDVNRNISRAQQPWDGSTDAITDRSLVFVAQSGPYLLFLNPFSANDADLQNRLLYSVDRGSANFELLDKYPDRVPYRQLASYRGDELGPREQPNTPKIEVTKLSVLRSNVVRLQAHVTNVTGARNVAVFLNAGDDDSVVVRPLDDRSRRGQEYDVTWVVTVPGGPRGMPVTARDGKLIVGVGYGGTAREASAEPDARTSFPFRVHDDALEVLVPGIADVLTNVDGAQRYRPVFVPRQLDVEARAAASP
jgi:hypothetical protein